MHGHKLKTQTVLLDTLSLIYNTKWGAWETCIEASIFVDALDHTLMMPPQFIQLYIHL